MTESVSTCIGPCVSFVVRYKGTITSVAALPSDRSSLQSSHVPRQSRRPFCLAAAVPQPNSPQARGKPTSVVLFLQASSAQSTSDPLPGDLMLPFIVALVFAVGLPLLPSSLYRALHLPTLKFNFLSARHAPEQVSVSSPGPALLPENVYSEAGSESSESPQYLTFPDIASGNCLNDAAAAPICMSLTEEQDSPQPSIWDLIHAQLLYQLAEATVIITLSFFATSAFLSRRYFCTFLERLTTALFISRHYSPKAAFSAFLQDVFCGLHQYWMDDNVSKGGTAKSVAKNSQQAALEVFANAIPGESHERDASVSSLVSVSNLQDTLDLASLDKSSLGSGSSSSASITLPHSTKVSSAIDPARTSPLDLSAHPLCSNIDISKQERSQFIHTETPLQPRINLSPSVETPGLNSDPFSPLTPSPPTSSTASLPSISMEDLYNSSRLITAPTFLPEPPRTEQKASVSDPSRLSQSSCGHESLSNVNSATTDPGFPPESNSTSSLISQSSRRRYKSDSIQVLATRCHLGDTTSLLDPAKVDVTCAFWKGAPQDGERATETLVKEAPAPARLPQSLPPPRIRRNTSEQGQNSLSAADAALAGLVVTTEGELIVPASQRTDGRYKVQLCSSSPLLIPASRSLRKEIRLRPGYALREAFAEKYLPPAARRRTSTWNPLFPESSASSPSSPHRHDSSLPSTPRDFCQGVFVHESNRGSLASQSDNWRRPNSGLASNARLPATVGKGAGAESTPVAVETPERNPAPAISPQASTALVKTDAITSTSMITTVAQATVPVVGQNTPIQPADHLPSPPTLDISTEKEMGSAAETTKASKSADAADNDPDNQENQQLEAPSPTPSAFTAAGRESRRPLRDITFSFSVPKSKAASEDLALAPPTTVETLAIFSHVPDIFPKGHLLRTPTRTSEDFDRAIRETALNSPRKRRQSAAESNLPVFQFKALSMFTPAHPNRLPRARRSAPHLGKYTGKQQQQQGKLPRAAQTPDGLKRRRIRTASSRGVENWTINLASASAAATPTIDHSGQIVLPAGTGWKGRSLVGAGQIPQRQRQPTAVLA